MSLTIIPEGGVSIKRVTRGSQADRAGTVHVADLVITINGADCTAFRTGAELKALMSNDVTTLEVVDPNAYRSWMQSNAGAAPAKVTKRTPQEMRETRELLLALFAKINTDDGDTHLSTDELAAGGVAGAGLARRAAAPRRGVALLNVGFGMHRSACSTR